VGNNVGFPFGVLLSYVLGGYLHWRTVSYIYAAIFFCHSIALRFLVPESPAWLYSKGRREEAKAALEYMARPEDWGELENEARKVI